MRLYYRYDDKTRIDVFRFIKGLVIIGMTTGFLTSLVVAIVK